ncbi:MAG: hypothetical protein WD749_12070 [Phycisphaerales bacterium]
MDLVNPAKLRRRGIELLVRELGHADAMRFLQQLGAGRRDYTAERGQLAPAMTDEETLAEADRLAKQDRARRAAG